MGGKKGGALGAWIKEFCTLVFIQTIQAFIYALIISLIVKIQFNKIDDVNDRNSSIGFLAVIALVSVFKIEEMVKKIVGFGNSKADVKGAMSSLAKTAIAWQFGKRVLDNGAKVAGGLRARSDAAKGRHKLKSRIQRDMATFNSEGDSGGALDEGKDQAAEYYEKAKQAKAAGNIDGYHTNMGIAAGIKKAGGTSGAKNGKNTRDYNAMMDKYQDQLAELKKKKRDATREIFKGVGETAGAIPGALAGAIIGGADGNLDEALRGAGVGMGIGDTIGEKLGESTYSAVKAPGAVRSGVGDVASFHKAAMQQKRDAKQLGEEISMARAWCREVKKNRTSEKELEQIIKNANKAIADDAN